MTTSSSTMLPALPALLDRLGLDALPPTDTTGLYRLVRAFRRTIPFENLDPLAGEAVSTALDAIVDKLVHRRRGGWCYELNGLFAELLREAGFPVQMALARVSFRRPGPGPLTHLVLRTEVDSRPGLVDVGFGGPGPVDPVPLDDIEATCRDGSRFRVVPTPEGGLSVSRWIEGQWELLYETATFEVLPIDLTMASHFLSTWDDSPFRRLFMCVAHDGVWNWTLDPDALVRRDAAWVETAREPIADATALRAVLSSRFGIDVPETIASRAWAQTRPA